MNVLILTQFYWPEARTAPTNLAAVAEGLKSKGHTVTVITGFPNHPFGRVYDGYRMRAWQWDEVRGVPVLRLPLVPDHSLSPLRRALGYLSFAVAALILGTIHSMKLDLDVLLVYLPPLTVGIPAALLGLLHGAGIIYWMTDVWPESLELAGARLNPLLRRLIRQLEDWVYRRAEVVCVNSPGLVSNLVSKGLPREKTEPVLDWADEDLFFPVDKDQELAKQWGIDGSFNVMYGGNLGVVQNLQTVLAAAKRLRDLPDIQFILIGDGNDEASLKAMVASDDIRNVRFVPRQPMDRIREFFALADVLLIHLKRDPLFKLQIPSKTMAYLACGRPILCAVSGEAERIVLDAQAGVSCPPEDPVAMAELLRELYLLPKPVREAMGTRGREAYLTKYTKAIQIDHIENVLSGVIQSRRNR